MHVPVDHPGARAVRDGGNGPRGVRADACVCCVVKPLIFPLPGGGGVADVGDWIKTKDETNE